MNKGDEKEMTDKEMTDLVKKVTDMIEENRRLRDSDKKFKSSRKKYKNVSNEPIDIYFVQEF